jgi:hypothetical protein
MTTHTENQNVFSQTTMVTASHLSAATSSDGLLQGAHFPDCEMYNNELKYWKPLGQMGYLLEAASADAAYLNCTAAGYIKGIRETYAEFLNSDNIADRSELKSFLSNAIVNLKSTGKVSIVWGPKSTGKTKLLESQCAQLSLTEDVLVVYINGRQKTLSHGIAEAMDKVRDNAPKDYEHIGQKMFESFSGVLNAAAALQVIQAGAATAAGAAITGVAAMASLVSAVKTLELCGKLETIQADLHFLEGFLKFSQAMGKHPSLVIDEANLIVTGDPLNQRLLSAICSHTKEHRAMNVTLCTSSHTYPHKLAALEGGLQLQHTQIQYAAELSQKEMWHFLTGTIQMGKNLARACIAACGGNVFLASDLLERAAEPKFKILRGLRNIEGASSIQSLLQDHEIEIVRLLEEMAKKGYCLVPNKQAESVKKIISARVAGIVDDDHVFPSELKNVLENDVHGTALVPSSEALRHLLLFEIKQQTNPGPASP